MVQISATAQLKKYIDRYLEERNGRSRQTLSKKTGVSYSTLSRISTLECETTFEHAVHILKEVASDVERQAFIKQYYPATFAALAGEESKYVGKEDASNLLQDRLNYELFTYSCHKGGLEKAFVNSQYGLSGMTACNNLVENGLLRFDERANAFRADNLTINVDLVKNLLRSGLENFSAVAATSDRIYSKWFSERLNPDACLELFKVLREADKKVISIMTSANSAGDIPYEYGIFSKPMSVKGEQQ